MHDSIPVACTVLLSPNEHCSRPVAAFTAACISCVTASTPLQVAEQACQAPGDLTQDSSNSTAPPQPGTATSSRHAAPPSTATAPQPGIPGLSQASGTFPGPQPLAHLSPSAIYACPDEPLLLAVVHTATSPSADTDGAMIAVQRNGSGAPGVASGVPGASAIAIWNLSDARAPAAILVCESGLRCCAFAPGTAGAVVVGGCADGTLGLWDTRARPLHHATCGAPGPQQAGSAAVPVFLPARTASASGLASSHAMSSAQRVLSDAEGVVCIEALQPRTASQRPPQAHGRGDGNHAAAEVGMQRGEAPMEWLGVTLLVLSVAGTVAQWAVTVASASGTARGEAWGCGSGFEATWDAPSASPSRLSWGPRHCHVSSTGFGTRWLRRSGSADWDTPDSVRPLCLQCAQRCCTFLSALAQGARGASGWQRVAYTPDWAG